MGGKKKNDERTSKHEEKICVTDKISKGNVVCAAVCLHSVRDLIFFYNSDDEGERY